MVLVLEMTRELPLQQHFESALDLDLDLEERLGEIKRAQVACMATASVNMRRRLGLRLRPVYREHGA